MTLSARARQRGFLAAGISLTLAASLMVAPDMVETVMASANAQCNFDQTDNTQFNKHQSWGVSLIQVHGLISYFDYGLCTSPDPGVEPDQSASSGWVGMEPTNGGCCSIIQVGYIKCRVTQFLGCSNFNTSQRGIVMAFWAWGINGDPWHMPFPNPLSTIPGAANGGWHTFDVFKVDRTSCYWAMAIDKGTSNYHYHSVGCSTLEWTPAVGNTAVENWNSGDQIGGWSGTPQRFKNELVPRPVRHISQLHDWRWWAIWPLFPIRCVRQ